MKPNVAITGPRMRVRWIAWLSGVFMNIEKLIEAAKEIDSLACKQEARTKAWSDLARDARNGGVLRSDIMRRRRELDECVVIDFGTAINKLRAALQGR